MELDLIKKLRSITGCGIKDCKDALLSCNNDIDKAIDILRVNGKTKAKEKSTRLTLEGLICIMINDNRNTATIVTIQT